MKLEILDIEPRYTGKYTIRVGKFYWLPAIGNPDNFYDMIRVKGAHSFQVIFVEVKDMSQEDIFQALELQDDQVILSMELL